MSVRPVRPLRPVRENNKNEFLLRDDGYVYKIRSTERGRPTSGRNHC